MESHKKAPPPLPPKRTDLLDAYIAAYAALRRYELTPDDGPEGRAWQDAYKAIHALHGLYGSSGPRRANAATIHATADFLRENRIWLDLLPNGRFEAHEIDE